GGGPGRHSGQGRPFSLPGLPPCFLGIPGVLHYRHTFVAFDWRLEATTCNRPPALPDSLNRPHSCPVSVLVRHGPYDSFAARRVSTSLRPRYISSRWYSP